jgi:hypothetical protein
MSAAKKYANLHEPQVTPLPQTFVANLWTEFTAFECYAMRADVKECETLGNAWWLQLLKSQKLTFLTRFRL